MTYYQHSFSKGDRSFLKKLGLVKESFGMDKMFLSLTPPIWPKRKASWKPSKTMSAQNSQKRELTGRNYIMSQVKKSLRVKSNFL
ncbi:hypothetical protein QNN00_14840 [Bacillus velezensis]|nr:hypothetical protein [Bacillus velezensis]